jgi:hypothetical protein
MKAQILFLQGAGEGAYKEDAEFAGALQSALGAEYHVIYPKMPQENSPNYDLWKNKIASTLTSLKCEPMLVGHFLWRFDAVEIPFGREGPVFFRWTVFTCRSVYRSG